MSARIPSVALDSIWVDDAVFASQWIRGTFALNLALKFIASTMSLYIKLNMMLSNIL